MATRQGNRAGRSCVIEHKSAALSTEFGMKMLLAKFADLAEPVLSDVGVYSRGPRKGLPRGYIHWTKIIEGGWHYGERRVYRPGTEGWAVRESADPESKDIIQKLTETAAQAAREVEAAAWNALTPAEQLIERSKKYRSSAHRRFAEGDVDDFHYLMKRARELVRGAHLIQ